MTSPASELLYVAITGVLSAAGGMGVFYWAIIGRFGRDFASREFVETEFAKVDRTMEGLERRVNATADKHTVTASRLDVLTERVAGQSDRLGEMHDGIVMLDRKVEEIGKGQATIFEALRGLTAAVEKLTR